MPELQHNEIQFFSVDSHQLDHALREAVVEENVREVERLLVLGANPNFRVGK